MRLLLDTHVLVWMDNDERKLGRKTRAVIERAWKDGEVGVSPVSFWEIGMLQSRRKLRLPAPLATWRKALMTAGLSEWPLDGETTIRALGFADLHDDPADRFIVATALERGAVLVTADERLLSWQHALDRQDASK